MFNKLAIRYSIALELFAKAVGAGKRKQVFLLMDRAGWHTSQKLVIPDGLHIVFQPTSSPELQPAEHLWPLIDEVLVNRNLPHIEEIEQLVEQRCKQLTYKKEEISSRTLFSWWPSY